MTRGFSVFSAREITFSRVTRVKRVFFQGPAASDAEQPGQDDEHEQHGGES